MGRPKKEITSDAVECSAEDVCPLKEGFTIDAVITIVNQLISQNDLKIDPHLTMKSTEEEIFKTINKAIAFMDVDAVPLSHGCGWKGIMAAINALVLKHNS